MGICSARQKKENRKKINKLSIEEQKLNEQILAQIYQQRQTTNSPTFHNQYQQPEHNQIKKQVTNIVPIQNEISILIDSLHLIQSTIKNDKTYYITFKFNCKCKARLQFYFFATDCTPEKSNIIQINQKSEENIQSEENSYLFNFSNNVVVFPPEKHYINISQLKEEQLTKISLLKYPLIIKLEKITEKNKQKEEHTLFVYCRFIKDKFNFEGKIQKQLLQHSGRIIKLNNIYGIHSQQLDEDFNQLNENEGANCAICLSEKPSVIILPCNHMCICSSCSDELSNKIQQCPLCRKQIKSLMQINNLNQKNKASN